MSIGIKYADHLDPILMENLHGNKRVKYRVPHFWPNKKSRIKIWKIEIWNLKIFLKIEILNFFKNFEIQNAGKNAEPGIGNLMGNSHGKNDGSSQLRRGIYPDKNNWVEFWWRFSIGNINAERLRREILKRVNSWVKFWWEFLIGSGNAERQEREIGKCVNSWVIFWWRISMGGKTRRSAQLLDEDFQ